MSSFQTTRPATASPGTGARVSSGPAPGTAMAPASGRRRGVPARRRSPAATPRVLALWRAASVLICLVVAVVSALTLNQNRSSLIGVDGAAQQLMRLQLVRGDVLAADAAAAGQFAAGQASQAPSSSYAGGLQDAAAVLSQASAASTVDRNALAASSQQLTGYSVALARAVQARDATLMTAASVQLRDGLLPKLDAQIQLNQARLTGSIADQRWLGALAVVPVLVLLVASVAVARRTRRVLNLGLVVALGVSAALGVVTMQLVTRSAESVGAVRQGEVVQATSAAQAYASVTEARACEARMLAGTVAPGQGEGEFQAAVAAARTALGNVPGAGAAGVATQLDTVASLHARVMSPGDPGQAAAQAQSQAAYQALAGWLPGQASTIGAGVDQQLTSHAQAIRNATGGTAAAMVFAAAAAGVGISQPLRRYR